MFSTTSGPRFLDPIIEARKRCGGNSIVFIGDSSYDMASARAAEVPFVAACYGYCDRSPEEFGADATILVILTLPVRLTVFSSA